MLWLYNILLNEIFYANYLCDILLNEIFYVNYLYDIEIILNFFII